MLIKPPCLMYVLVGKCTMDSCGSKLYVLIKGLNDKCNITLPLIIMLSGNILPFQIIYAGKMKACHP